MNQARTRTRKPLFISMRWRFILPLAIIITIVAMIGAYSLASRMASGFEVSEDNVLIQSSQAVANRAVTLYDRQRSEAQRVAFTQGVAENIILNDVVALHDTLESLARTADLDSIIVTDPAGLEVAGVLRVNNSNPVDYSISTQFDLSDDPLVREILDTDRVGSTGFIQTPQGLMVFVAVPIINDGSFAGVALVGQRLATMVDNLRASAVAHLTIYDNSGSAYHTSLELDTTILENLLVPDTTIETTLVSPTPVSDSVTLAGTPYRRLFTPFNYGGNTLAVIATLVPDNVPFASAIGRQLSAVFAAIMAGVVVFITFVVVDRYAARLDKISKTAKALSAGQSNARTGMRASDEIGAVGAELDQFATISQQREDHLRTELWRQRRERNYIGAVFEAIPEGLVVQDRDGEIVMMNDIARQLLGSRQTIQQEIASLGQRLPQSPGRELAPGIYALGNPQNLQNAGQMISAQAAAILTHNRQRIGTVMLLRDITSEVQKEQQRDALLSQLSADIQQPLEEFARSQVVKSSSSVREISKYAASLQRMIVDMRELTRYSSEHSRNMQRPLLAETLLYAVANDWRQIAQAAGHDLSVMIEENGHYILGDESRLRLAIGNLMDNAIKYTPRGGNVTLEIKTIVNGMLHLRVRDNGVGISEDDLKSVFMPFYRGTPMLADSSVIHVPGMGQGLPIARQIIRAHGGLLKVKSRPAVGSAIYFALPVTSGASYTLPLLEDADMEGETINLPSNVDIDAIWKRQ